ncbi:MAG: hypothetical protein OXR72_05955 [Gemmatimonadota bacterium]|nr:hypothetical protein [Gemmatimonadota bacterium]
MNQPLPHSDQLDIATLSGLFRHTTNSYKYLFFVSLLSWMKDRRFEVYDGIPLRELEIEMLVTAWYPHVFFKLSFGTQDRIASALRSVPHIDDNRKLLTRSGRDELRRRLADSVDVPDHQLTRYVPHRILRPFFSCETRGMPDQRVNREVANLADELFQVRRPLFRFDHSEECIHLHPGWIAYLKDHQTILDGWALWHWADYMQRRNPGIPAVTRKLLPPERRAPLNSQKKFWKTVFDKSEIRCIYSGKTLNSDYVLDHFLPWRFVAHDQLWNLVPVDSQVNSSKSDWIPSEIYLDSLAETQRVGLSVARDSLSDEKWRKEVAPYITDLYIDAEETLDSEKLKSAYHRTLKPLMSIAEQQGFQSGWTYEA